MKRPAAKLYELATAIESSERERAAGVDALNQPPSPPTLNGGESPTLSHISDLWGPVVTDKQDEFYQRCDIGSNNTGELTGILQALLWAKQQGGQEPFALCYDSMYAANITSGLWKPKTNKGIASLCHEHFLAESERRKGGVHLIHIKGHSDQLGNEKADERVQWGKENGPYCRFRLDGTSEGDYIDQPRPTTATPSPSHPSPSKQLRATANSSLKPLTSNLGKNRPHQDSTPKPNASTASKRIDVCHRAHLATPPMDAGFTSALRDPTAAFAVSFLRPCALNFDKVCQTVNQSAQIAQQRISKSILDSMTMDTPTRTLAAERPARVYDPMVTPSVSRGSYGHYLRRNANRSATQRAQKRASPSATDSITSDMADHALEHQPNRTTRDSRTQDTAHLSHLQEAMYISHPTQQRRDIFIFGNSDNTR